MMQFPDAITFSLLQAVLGRQAFVLCFKNRERNRLRARRERTSKHIIGSPCGSSARLMVYDVYWLGGFLDSNIRSATPAPFFQGGINQFKTNLCFVAGHFSTKWPAKLSRREALYKHNAPEGHKIRSPYFSGAVTTWPTTIPCLRSPVASILERTYSTLRLGLAALRRP